MWAGSGKVLRGFATCNPITEGDWVNFDQLWGISNSFASSLWARCLCWYCNTAEVEYLWRFLGSFCFWSHVGSSHECSRKDWDGQLHFNNLRSWRRVTGDLAQNDYLKHSNLQQIHNEDVRHSKMTSRRATSLSLQSQVFVQIRQDGSGSTVSCARKGASDTCECHVPDL